MGFWAAQCGLSDNHDTGTPWGGPKHDDQYADQQDLQQHCHQTDVCADDGTYCLVTWYGDSWENQPTT